MLKKLALFILFFVLGCIDPVDFKYNGNVEHLVVEGRFTNEVDGNYVRLSKTRPFESPYYVFVEGAIVYVFSEEGERFDFYDNGSGYYYPATEAIGIIDHTYTLHVETGEGEIYESEAATMLPSVPIDSVRYEDADGQAQIEGQVFQELMSGFRFFVDYADPGNIDNFYRWSYQTEFEVLTQPRDYIERGCRGCPRPAPKDCCAVCWITREQDAIVVGDDRLSDGRQVIRQPVFFLPYQMYMKTKMRLTVKQHAISQQAFNFYNSMLLQKENTGEVFDPPPTEIKGNMKNINDETEQVVGLFEVSSIATKQIEITENMVQERIPEFIYIDDCRVIENSTTDRPENW